MSKKHKQCPVCKVKYEQEQVLAEPRHGDRVTYDCPRCGRYTMTGTAEAMTALKDESAQLSSWLKERNLFGVNIPILTSEFLEKVISTIPSYTPLEKQNKLLKAIEFLTDYPGKEVILFPDYSPSLAWAQNENEFKYYLSSLMERGLLKMSSSNRSLSDPLYPMIITPKGWEHLESNRSDLTDKIQAFVAMSFDETMLSVYNNAISLAIEATGYRPYRIDSEPHLERIDAKIIAEIKNSRFVVADVTQQKAGVYYEAGFAGGLGIPVIWCVRHEDLKNVHFDTRQFRHILWDSEQELKE